MIMKIEGKRYFFTGLLIVLPVLITIYLFISLFMFFDNILGRYISSLTITYLGFKIPGLGLLVFILLIFFTGFFATNFLGRKLFHFFESLWSKFPVVKQIYPAAKQVTKFLFGQGMHGQLKKVVLIRFPHSGLYSVGFMTNQADNEISEKLGKDDFICVLVPNVPNPLSGFIVFVPRRDVIFLDMAIEDAIKIVVSGGVLSVNNGTKSNPPIS
jgi:uncharacterized membrane protein